MGKDYCPSGKLVDVNVSMIFNHVFLVFTPDRNFVMNIGILTEHIYLDTFILLCVDKIDMSMSYKKYFMFHILNICLGTVPFNMNDFDYATLLNKIHIRL